MVLRGGKISARERRKHIKFMKPSLLLHVCCAPCLISTLPYLGGYDISCFWYNPNIHPFTEYKHRLGALLDYTSENNIILKVKDYYGLFDFAQNVINNPDGRCGYCYETRIKETAQYAKGRGFDLFSATLLVSPYQNHAKIKQTCEKYGAEYNIPFFYGDFRGNFKEGQKTARERDIYRQKYCGCIFSKRERYAK